MRQWPLLFCLAFCFERAYGACPAGTSCSATLDADVVSLLQVSTVSADVRRHSDEEAKEALPALYPWSQRGRGPLGNSFTPYTAPSDFSAGPSWKWNNDLDEQVRHSPLIDNDMNVYVATSNRIRKFSKDGMLLWTWQNKPEEGKMVASPALYEGAVYLISRTGAESGPPPVPPKVEDEEDEPEEDEEEEDEKDDEAGTDTDESSELSLLQTAKSQVPWWELAAEKEEASVAAKAEKAVEAKQQKAKKAKKAKKEAESIRLPPLRKPTITMVSLNMTTGNVIWKKSEPLQQNSDPGSVFVYNGTMVFALGNDDMHVQQPNTKGNNIIYAVKASDGTYLWEVVADDVFYNFAAASPGDGTFLFSSSCGSVFRVSFDGQLIWRKGDPEMSLGYHCSSGGGALGSNGVYYVEYDDVKDNTKGARLAAYQVSDGALLWKKMFNSSDRGLQHPAVGRLGSDGPLAVLVAVGQGFSQATVSAESTAVPSKVATPVDLEATSDTQEEKEEKSDEQEADDSKTEETASETENEEQDADTNLISEGSEAETSNVDSDEEGSEEEDDKEKDESEGDEKEKEKGEEGGKGDDEDLWAEDEGGDMAKEWKDKHGFGKQKKKKGKKKVDYSKMYFKKSMADVIKEEEANETEANGGKPPKKSDKSFWKGGDKTPTWMKWLPADAFDDTVLLQTDSEIQESQLPVNLDDTGSSAEDSEAETEEAEEEEEDEEKKEKKKGHSKAKKPKKKVQAVKVAQPVAKLSNAVVALDAQSGEVLWRFNEEPWEKRAGAGEAERALERVSRAMKDDQADVLCSADTQGTPLIGGDGTVYMTSGHSGDLRAIRDVNRDGVIDMEREVSLFKTHNCFLNSPSLAPGMLVAAPCWGPMYVFKL